MLPAPTTMPRSKGHLSNSNNFHNNCFINLKLRDCPFLLCKTLHPDIRFAVGIEPGEGDRYTAGLPVHRVPY